LREVEGGLAALMRSLLNLPDLKKSGDRSQKSEDRIKIGTIEIGVAIEIEKL